MLSFRFDPKMLCVPFAKIGFPDLWWVSYLMYVTAMAISESADGIAKTSKDQSIFTPVSIFVSIRSTRVLSPGWPLPKTA